MLATPTTPTGLLSQDANAVTGITSDVTAAIAARQPLRYAGYAYDAHSATYYLSQRHYDPATMRFLTKDPARDDGEESAYQYCAGDPVGKVDPDGCRTIAGWAVRLSYAMGVGAILSQAFGGALVRRIAGRLRSLLPLGRASSEAIGKGVVATAKAGHKRVFSRTVEPTSKERHLGYIGWYYHGIYSVESRREVSFYYYGMRVLEPTRRGLPWRWGTQIRQRIWSRTR